MNGKPVRHEDIHYYEMPPPMTSEALAIVNVLVPEWLKLFLQKNALYAGVQHLGSAGVFPDINRKFALVQSGLWEWAGEPVPRRPPEGPTSAETREAILDLIGHLFLALALYDQESRDAVPVGTLVATAGFDPDEPNSSVPAPVAKAPVSKRSLAREYEHLSPEVRGIVEWAKLRARLRIPRQG